MRHPFTTAPLAAVAVLAAAPPGADAQSVAMLTPYIARDDALPATPYLAGLALSAWQGAAGVRVSGALSDPLTGLRGRTSASSAGAPAPGRAWSADVDAVLATPLAGAPALGSELFLGAGVHGVEHADGTVASLPVWSAGGGLRLALLSALSLESEARYRMPLPDSASVPAGFVRGWEYRLGLAFRFGGAGSPYALDRPPGGRPNRRVRPGDAGGPASAAASAVIASADAYLGTPYRYGGTTPAGFDCSGFVGYVFRANGVSLPRTARAMAKVGDDVAPLLVALAPGDLVLFAGEGEGIDHVAIYTGEERIIHATASGDGVRYDDLRTPRGRWFVRHMVAARRVLGPADGRLRLDASLDTSGPLDPPDRAPHP